IIDAFKAKGFTVEIAFSEVSLESAMNRALERFLSGSGEGRRFVDPKYIASHDHKNLESFLELRGKVDKWSHWDNEVPFGEQPILLGESKNRRSK
ncbi:MAG: hypothetical protein WC341_00345, partial [Bacteroidales bacterium]